MSIKEAMILVILTWTKNKMDIEEQSTAIENQLPRTKGNFKTKIKLKFLTT
jgi:hypothetical protein